MRGALRRSAAASVLAFACALGVAAQARPDVRIVNDDGVRLRAAASSTSRIIRKLDRTEPVLVLATEGKSESLNGATGSWQRIRASDGGEGWVFGPFLRAATTAFGRPDFDSSGRYADYLGLALRKGERVRAARELGEIRRGELGSFFARSDASSQFLIVWDRDLGRAPETGSLGEGFPMILSDRARLVDAAEIEIVGDAKVAEFPGLALDRARLRSGDFRTGASVAIGRHLRVSADPDSDNWDPDMDQYVGVASVVVSAEGDDPYGRPVVRIEADGGQFFWRIENMTLAPTSVSRPQPAAPSVEAGDPASTEGYGRIGLGSAVILGKHDGAAGDANWNEDMDRYVGEAAKVVELSGSDSTGFLGVRVEGNDWFWRVRNLALEGRGEPGSYGYAVGDRVVLGKHREVGGEADWNPEMERFVGKTATITSLVGADGDPSGCYTVRVDIDGGAWYWRAESLKPSR